MHHWQTPQGYLIEARCFSGLIVKYYYQCLRHKLQQAFPKIFPCPKSAVTNASLLQLDLPHILTASRQNTNIPYGDIWVGEECEIEESGSRARKHLLKGD